MATGVVAGVEVTVVAGGVVVFGPKGLLAAGGFCWGPRRPKLISLLPVKEGGGFVGRKFIAPVPGKVPDGLGSVGGGLVTGGGWVFTSVGLVGMLPKRFGFDGSGVGVGFTVSAFDEAGFPPDLC